MAIKLALKQLYKSQSVFCRGESEIYVVQNIKPNIYVDSVEHFEIRNRVAERKQRRGGVGAYLIPTKTDSLDLRHFLVIFV